MYVFLQVIGGLLFIIGQSISLPLFSWVGGILFVVAWIKHTAREDEKEKQREQKLENARIKRYEEQIEQEHRNDRITAQINKEIADDLAKERKRKKALKERKSREETRKAKLKKLKSNNTRKRK